MARDRLTEEEFDEAFGDHLARNPMLRATFKKLPEGVRGKLQGEWFGVWRTLPFEDLQAASRLFLADPDHPLAPAKDINKHCGRVAKLAKQLWGERRRDERGFESEFAPGEETRPGCPTCNGGRRVQVWPFGQFKAWSIELFGAEYWQAARAVRLLCPCNGDLIEALEDRYSVDAREDHFPRGTPRGDDWPLDLPTIFDEDRHEPFDQKTHFLTKFRYEKDVLELGKPRIRYGPNPNTGESMLDDLVDLVWGDTARRPIPDHLRNVKPWAAGYKPAAHVYRRPEAKKLGHVVDRVTEDVEKTVAMKDRQLPPRDRDDFEPDAEALEEAAASYRKDEPDPDGSFLGMSDDELDEELGPPTSLNFEGPPAEPETLSREERRRRRRAALGKDS